MQPEDDIEDVEVSSFSDHNPRRERSEVADGRLDPPKLEIPSSSFPALSTVDPRLGTTLNGRYRIEKLIGKGGMGRVYLATQFPLNRHVAVKVLNPEFQKKDPQFVRRFFLEASTAARLTHPNTITVFDYGESEMGELFIAMEHLKGRPLSKVITTDGPFSAERTLHIAVQICRALREAHQKGIIHRDLKPGNILLLEEGDDADFVKVLDFGLVKVFTPPQPQKGQGMGPEPLTPGPQLEPGDLTRAGMFLGSPKYMSPEQIKAEPLDTRTDIYSLGVLMYQMLAGKPPFSGATSVEVIYKHVNHPVPPIAELSPGVDVPEGLEQVVRQCLEKDREKRFASMGDLLVKLKELRRAISGVSSTSEIGVSVAHLLAHGPQSAISDLSKAERLTIPRDAQPRATSLPRAPLESKTSGPAMRAQPEAAFVDISDDVTPPSGVRARPPSTPVVGRLARIAPMAAATALVLALGVLAYVFSAGPKNVLSEEARTGAPIPPAARAPVNVSFASTPEGAQVFLDGRRLGVTPFALAFAAEEAAEGPKRFVFKLEAYADEVLIESLETSSVKLHAHMHQEKKTQSSEYKENPY
jgi:serine/threonine-protein kinase